MSEEQVEEEKLTAIIGFRIYPSLKVQLYEEAAARGKTLSEFLYQCIEAGWEKLLIEEDVEY
jgi:hypothetical protein